MRTLILALAVFTATPVLAQVDPAQTARENDLWAQQQMQNQRAVALENQVNAIDARVGTEVRLREMQANARQPLLPQTYAPKSNAEPTSLAQFPEIPDDKLADSNARVRAASQNKR